MFLLVNCAACAAPLAHDAPRCVRCKTRYCNSTCQHDHWRRGHKQICKKIYRGGNAEQYHADKKYKEAVAVAVEACAADTKGQTCYICTEALHWKTKEALVRGCACRRTSGFAHVSCLAEQAKILVEEAEANNLKEKFNERWMRWLACSLCEQQYHGFVACALGFACWKTYVGRSDEEFLPLQSAAMSALGFGLQSCGRPADAIVAYEAVASGEGSSDYARVDTLNNIAVCLGETGKHEEALSLRRRIYAIYKADRSRVPATTYFSAADNLVNSLQVSGLFNESKTLLHDIVPEARRTLGPEAPLTLSLRRRCVSGLIHQSVIGPERIIPIDNLREAIALYEDIVPIYQRVFGSAHPETKKVHRSLVRARENLATAPRVPLPVSRAAAGLAEEVD